MAGVVNWKLSANRAWERRNSSARRLFNDRRWIVRGTWRQSSHKLNLIMIFPRFNSHARVSELHGFLHPKLNQKEFSLRRCRWKFFIAQTIKLWTVACEMSSSLIVIRFSESSRRISRNAKLSSYASGALEFNKKKFVVLLARRFEQNQYRVLWVN